MFQTCWTFKVRNAREHESHMRIKQTIHELVHVLFRNKPITYNEESLIINYDIIQQNLHPLEVI